MVHDINYYLVNVGMHSQMGRETTKGSTHEHSLTVNYYA